MKQDEKCCVVAITGRSGSGKTQAGAYLAKKGYVVIDADKLSVEVTSADSLCLQQLTAYFGNDIVDKNGVLQRRMLAQRAFASPQSRDALTNITHPHIIAELLRRIEKAAQSGEKVVFVDGAVIVGEVFEQYCDKIVVIMTTPENELSRIMQRDKLDLAQAENRIARQTPREKLLERADMVIENNLGTEDLQEKIEYMLQKFQLKE